MMNANEAKQNAQRYLGEKDYPKIMNDIKMASLSGKFECWIYVPITDEVRKKLVEDGYKVGKEQFDRNEVLTKISWL